MLFVKVGTKPNFLKTQTQVEAMNQLNYRSTAILFVLNTVSFQISADFFVFRYCKLQVDSSTGGGRMEGVGSVSE